MTKITKESFNLGVGDREIHYFDESGEDTSTWDNAPNLTNSTVILIEPGELPKIVDNTDKRYGDLIYKTKAESDRDGIESAYLHGWSKEVDGVRLLGDDMTIFYDAASEGEYNFATKASYFSRDGELRGVDVAHIKGNAVIAVYSEVMTNITITKTHLEVIKDKFIESETIDGITTWVLGK